MTLIEALRSNRRFRNKESYYWYNPQPGTTLFCVFDIIADYEIEEPKEDKIEITKSQLASVWDGIVNSSRESPMFDRFANALGFKP